jgi:hypothetical protein
MSRSELQTVDETDHQQYRAPPDIGMQVKEHDRRMGRRMQHFPHSSAGNQNSVHQQGNPDKKPNGNAAFIARDITACFYENVLPKNGVQDHKNYCYHPSPKEGLLIKR